MSDSNDAFEALESSGCGSGDVLEDRKDTNGFSEHELIDFMYNSCKASNTGDVLSSTIIQYLQTLTAQSADQDKLAALQRLLDPNQQDPHVGRETFHSIMREWLAQCGQNSSDMDVSHVISVSPEMPVNELDLSLFDDKPGISKVQQCFCEEQDLSEAMAEMKHANRKLSEQNRSLLRMLAQCEDVNLQLSLEVTELQTKLVSVQRSAIRVRSLTEELEETHQMLKESEERASCTRRSFTKLTSEVERLKVHIGELEDKNEKLSFESSCAEDNLIKLRRVNTELRAEHKETLLTLMLRERETIKKDILMEKMKNSHLESHKMIEGLQSELMRLQEHSHQTLLRYSRHFVSPQSLHSSNPPSNRSSLQSEIQDIHQQHQKALDDQSVPSFHKHINGVQIHRVKSKEKTHHLHNKPLEKDSSAVQERPFHQQQTTIKHHFSNVLQEQELCKFVWEEKEEKVEGKQKEKNQNQTGSQNQIQEARKVAVGNWWRSHSVEEAKICTKGTNLLQELSEKQVKLLQEEDATSGMRKQFCHLQASLRSGQECAKKKTISGVPHTEKSNDTDEQETGTTVEKVVKDHGDAAVVTEPEKITASEQKQTQVATDGLLVTLGRIEVMVSSALETAELVRQSEQRVSQVTRRMEDITQRVEEAAGRAANTDEQLNTLEATITEKTSSQSPGLSLPADPGSDTTGPIDSVEPEKTDGTKRPLPPVFPEVTEPPQRPMNGATGRGSCGSELQQEEKLLQQESPFKQGRDAPFASERPFIFPYVRLHPSRPPVMPTLPEEEEDSPEEMDSSSSSPSTSTPAGESQVVIVTTPTIVYPQQSVIVQQEGRPLQQNRPHSPRARQARNSTGGPITTVDSTGNVIDLVKDQLPELQLSEEDRQKNLELLDQAKKVSDRFLTRRGRRSTSSLTDSPTGLSPTPTPSTSPCSSRSSSIIVAPQTAAGTSETAQVNSQSLSQHLDVPTVKKQPDLTNQEQEDEVLVDWKPSEKRKVSSGTLKPRFAVQKENCDLAGSKGLQTVNKSDEVSGRNQNLAPATGVAKPVPRPPTQQAPCTAEIKTIGAFPPLMRAVSWDAGGSLNSRTGAPSFPPPVEETFSDKPREGVFKSSGYKDFPTLPGSKLSKLREEHKLIRNQSIVGSKLPDLNEAAEQEKGPPPSSKSTTAEEMKEKSDALPNISDVMLRKLKLHRGLPGCAPPLTEKEVENAFVQLSLAFRNDNYTLETRLRQAERERNLTEEDTEKELEEFKGSLKMTAPQWQNMEQREAYQRLIETVAVLYRLTTRLSSRAEIVGAVRQEKRMNKATEVMMQYVENLRRTYEKDHAELMEFKKLANQNSNRCYGASGEPGDDGVPRSSRSMSITLGKALPRRRVSVAVVPKFNLLNVPGQNPTTASPGSAAGSTAGPALPVLCEANDVKSSPPSEAAHSSAECGKSLLEQESESAKPSVNLEEIRAEIKAKIEEEAYNKGYQEGLKQSKALLEEKSEDENDAEKLLELKHKDEESGTRYKSSRRISEVLALLNQFCPKISVTRRLLWIFLMLFVVMCVVISIFTFFSDYHNRREDT